jgi:hypothetical protein
LTHAAMLINTPSCSRPGLRLRDVSRTSPLEGRGTAHSGGRACSGRSRPAHPSVGATTKCGR